MKKMITVSGSPGSGKTSLCMGLNSALSRMGKNVFYAHEWVKDWANRKVPIDSLDQFQIFGGQTGLLVSGIKSGCEYITCCTSPELCAFYSNYYGDNHYESMIRACREFDYQAQQRGWSTRKIFLYRSEDKYRQYYRQEGRYEDLDASVKMQEEMKEWFVKHFPEVEFKTDIDEYALIPELIGVKP